MSWVSWMYVATAVGSVGGVFYPTLVQAFDATKPAAVSATAGWGRWVAFLVVGTVLGSILAGVSFAAFLGNAENQAALKSLGSLAYFSAATAGFTAGSMFEEPFKQ